MITAVPAKGSILIRFDGGFIRPLTMSDIHTGYVDGLNDGDVNKYLVAVREHRQTLESVREFVNRSSMRDDEILFGIWETGAELHCGTVRLHSIEYRYRTGVIGVCLFDKRAWGRGLGSGAIRALTKWAHEVLRLRWIEAGVYAENLASLKVFAAAGYECVYDIPDKYLFDGRPATVKMFASRAAISTG